MASRQGGPGNAESPRPGSTERRTASTTAPAGSRRRTPPRTDSLPHGPRSPGTRTLEDGQRSPTARTAEDPPVRDPGRYALTDHFRERLEQPGRYVSTRAVSDAIRRGQLRWNRTDGWRFALVDGGVRFVVVVGDTGTNSPVVVTGWTEVADRETALETPRWDPVDIDTIAVRTALSESASAPIPDRIRPRTVTRPFVVGDHRLETAPGEPFVRCTACGRRFRSKDAITEWGCQSGKAGR